MRIILITLMFSVLNKKSRTFSSLPIILMRRCAGAGSTARQLAQAGQWKYSMPWMSCSFYRSGLAGGRNLFFFFSSLFCEFESSLVQGFELS